MFCKQNLRNLSERFWTHNSLCHLPQAFERIPWTFEAPKPQVVRMGQLCRGPWAAKPTTVVATRLVAELILQTSF